MKKYKKFLGKRCQKIGGKGYASKILSHPPCYSMINFPENSACRRSVSLFLAEVKRMKKAIKLTNLDLFRILSDLLRVFNIYARDSLGHSILVNPLTLKNFIGHSRFFIHKMH